MEGIRLQHADAVLRADGASPLAHILVHPRFQGGLDLLVLAWRDDIEVNISVDRMAPHVRSRLRIGGKPLRHFVLERVPLPQRQAQIVLVDVSRLAGGYRTELADMPKLRSLLVVLGDDSINHGHPPLQRRSLVHCLLQEGGEAFTVLVLVRAVRLDEDVVWVVGGHAHVLSGHDGHVHDAAHCVGIHELEGAQNLVDLALGEFQRLTDGVNRVTGQESDLHGPGQRSGGHANLGDDAQRAFGAEEELPQRIARVVLATRIHQIQDLPSAQHDFQASDVAEQRPKAAES
eukprot:scaffold4678_cov242-Pinguiococcus_pyrenoidosus.AAC.4